MGSLVPLSAIGATLPSGWQLVIILVVVLLLFGARKLPELGSSVGRSIRNFKEGLGEADEADEQGAAEEAEDRPEGRAER